VHGIDGQHEEAGYAWLLKYFGPEVTEPVRLHVDAQRYLGAKNTAYLEGLSPASQLALGLQGGPMTPLERAKFETNPHYRDAVRLCY
jgi:[1-hydroxy-2-(trimethylamino)ethyl]phosphonate dioxygenase